MSRDASISPPRRSDTPPPGQVTATEPTIVHSPRSLQLQALTTEANRFSADGLAGIQRWQEKHGLLYDNSGNPLPILKEIHEPLQRAIHDLLVAILRAKSSIDISLDDSIALRDAAALECQAFKTTLETSRTLTDIEQFYPVVLSRLKLRSRALEASPAAAQNVNPFDQLITSLSRPDADCKQILDAVDLRSLIRDVSQLVKLLRCDELLVSTRKYILRTVDLAALIQTSADFVTLYTCDRLVPEHRAQIESATGWEKVSKKDLSKINESYYGLTAAEHDNIGRIIQNWPPTPRAPAFFVDPVVAPTTGSTTATDFKRYSQS